MPKTVTTAPAKPVATTTDTGRVKVGGGVRRFAKPVAPTSDNGRVKVGGGVRRF